MQPGQRLIIKWWLALWVAVTLAGCGAESPGEREDTVRTQPDGPFTRIVSLSPSITETLYALGCGDRVVGVTRFCTYPPEAASKPTVGGYLDPNYEMLVSLTPDLVLLLPEQDSIREYLDRLDIRHETVHNRTVDEILATIDTIGTLCGAEPQADSLRGSIEQRMDTVRRTAPARSRPRVLISVGRAMGTGSLTDVYVAGAGTSYDELIELAGGVNAYADDTIAYPLLSAEGLLHLDPEIIIDLAPGYEEAAFDCETALADWRHAGQVTAVRDSAVYLFTENYTTIPGPRFILFLEDLAAIIREHANSNE